MLPFLVAAAVAAFAAAIALMLSGAASPAAAAHLAFAAGAMPLIFGAMLHFVPVLTRSRAPAPALQGLPFAATGAGLLAAGAFFLPDFFRTGVHAGASLALAAAVTLAAWAARRAKHALGAPHPCLAWYLAALLCLALALAAALGIGAWPGERAALRVFHLHLNTLGFVGLTAIGTLQVLLPTAVGRPDAEAGRRLRGDLLPAVTGVLFIAAGAAWLKPLAYLGLILLLFAVVRLGTAWAVRFWNEIGRLHGAAPSLSLALFGLAALLFAGAGHANGRLDGNDAIFGFVLGFLLPLVTGAAGQLLPLWLKPGAQTAWHQAVRGMLTRFGGLRAAACVVAGLGVALGLRAAAWIAAAALALFVVQLSGALIRRKA